jgi:hypothetical protein
VRKPLFFAIALYTVVATGALFIAVDKRNWTLMALVLISTAVGLLRGQPWVNPKSGPIDLSGIPSAIAAAARADEAGSPQANQLREFGGTR